MSLFTDLKDVFTAYAQRIKGLAAADEEIKADLDEISEVVDTETVDVYEYTPVELGLVDFSGQNHGVTFTQSSDGSVSAVGTNNHTAGLIYGLRNTASTELTIPLTAGDKYRLSGCPSGGGSSTYGVSIRYASGGGSLFRDNGSGVVFDVPETTTYKIHVIVAVGVTINKVFTPKLEKMTVIGQKTINVLSANDKTLRESAVRTTTLATEYNSNNTYLKGDYCSHNALVYKANTDILVGEEWDSTHWNIVNITDEFKKNDSSFKLDGIASNYISNVKIYGERFNCAFSNLRNHWTNSSGVTFTGVYVYETNETFSVMNSGKETHINFDVDAVAGHCCVRLHNGRLCEFDYDLSGIPEGIRIASYGSYSEITGYRHLVKDECFFDITAENEYFGFGFARSFGVVGDSYASGEIHFPDGSGRYSGHDYYEQSWGQILARKYGNTCHNFSKGALTTRTWLTDTKGLTLLQNTEALPLYICTLGINDIGKLGANYIGSSSDIHLEDSSLNGDTFYGNYGRILSAIKLKNPDAKIIIFSVACGYSALEDQYNVAIKEIASIFSIPYVNMEMERFFRPTSKYYTERVNGHPTATGYSGMAEGIDRLLNWCVSSNYGYFKDYKPITT